MGEVVNQFRITVDQVEGYEFRVKFDKEHYAELSTDEPAPLGSDRAPAPARILAAAVGSCMGASFVFACRKQGVAVRAMQTTVSVEIVRTENRRLRVGRIEVTLDPRLSPGDLEKARAAAQVFEDFCTVSASVKQGIPIEAKVLGITA
jgi:uncharacterized OsmC-like protein